MWNQLIECKRKGEFAVAEFPGDYICTTDDIPALFETMNIEDVYAEMKLASVRRRLKELDILHPDSERTFK